MQVLGDDGRGDRHVPFQESAQHGVDPCFGLLGRQLEDPQVILGGASRTVLEQEVIGPAKAATGKRGRSRPPRLLLADFASADSLFSSWTILNRAVAHNVLSSKRRSPSSPRARKSSKPNSLVRRKIRPLHPSHLPAISSSRQSLPPREKVSVSKERNRDTRVTSELPFPSMRSTRRGIIA